MMLLCNAAIPLLLFIRKLRIDLVVLFTVSIFVNIGMWLDRYVIIVSSLSHDFDPANWSEGVYTPTWVEGHHGGQLCTVLPVVPPVCEKLPHDLDG